MRPPIPRPISGNKTMQVKFIDDASQAASINMKASLVPDPETRPFPLKYHERTGMILAPEENQLQKQLDSFQDFATRNLLLVNNIKCKTMLINFSKNVDFPPEFSIGDSGILEEATLLRILGVMITPDLKWEANTAHIIKKAMSKIWILRRMRQLGVDERTIADFWAKEGRVHLELAVPVWHSGLTVRQSAAIERVQRIAVAAITSQWQEDYDSCLSRLGLSRLSDRRLNLCRRFCQRTVTASRHKDLFPVNPNPHNTRQRGQTYMEPVCRTRRRFMSARPYLTRLLNSS